MGDNVFSNMALSLQHKIDPVKTISRAEYETWRNEYVMDALQGLRYGQSFCNRFNITDNILFYERDVEFADRYIHSCYVDTHNNIAR